MLCNMRIIVTFINPTLNLKTLTYSQTVHTLNLKTLKILKP
jgi:hypothetical protein